MQMLRCVAKQTVRRMKDSVNNEADQAAVPDEVSAVTASNAVEGNPVVNPEIQPAEMSINPPSSESVPEIMPPSQTEARPPVVDVPPQPAPMQSSPPAPAVQPVAEQTPNPRPEAADGLPVPAPSGPASKPTSSITTLSNDAILASPTPVDHDPPPLVDVPPLSAKAPSEGVSKVVTLPPTSPPDDHLPPPRPRNSIPPQREAVPPRPLPVVEAQAAEPPTGANLTPIAELPPKPDPYAETGPEMAAKTETEKPVESALEDETISLPDPEPEARTAPVSIDPLTAARAGGLTLPRNETEIPLPESDEEPEAGESTTDSVADPAPVPTEAATAPVDPGRPGHSLRP